MIVLSQLRKVRKMGVNPYTKKPWCYGHPNELCSSTHEETDIDCEFLDECVRMFRDSLERSVKNAK